MITLRTLGESVVEVDGVRHGPDTDTVFPALVYLTAERGRQLSRQQFAELFWPGAAPDRARHSLRQLLYRLRALGVEVEGTRERVWLPDAAVARTFSAHPSVERLRDEQARGAFVVGPFLPGYAPAFSAAFREWLEGHRSVIEGQVRRALLDAAHEHRLRGEWDALDALAREVLRIDPFNQVATMAQAECAAMTGAVREALSILERYESEFGDGAAELTRPAVLLRRRIAEQIPARRYSAPSESCFVGRAGLMSVLTVALLRAKNGDGSALLLWGPPGIGKTRLTQELSRLAVVQAVRTVRVQCEESDGRQPMAAFVDAVPQLLRLPGALGVSPDAMPFLRRLTEFDPSAREPSPEARDPQYLAGRIRQSILDLVDAIAGEGALLLVFEDVHWMDAASWATVRSLVEWAGGKSVLVLMTSRRPHATASPPQREVLRLELHEVAALDATASEALVGAIARDFGRPLPDGAAAWCTAVGEGNPLFLRELVVHCLQGGAPCAAPPSVQALLDARIARLRPAARRALQAAAVLGEQATVDRLDRVLEMPAHELVGALDELSDAGLVTGTEPLVRPRHDLVAARVAAATSAASRRFLHRRAAVVLEAEVQPGSALELMWACASHWRATGQAGRGLTTVLAVANQLIELGSPRAVVGICDEAEALCSSARERFAIARLRATVEALTGQWHRAAGTLSRLVDAETGIEQRDVLVSDVLDLLEAQARSHARWPETVATASDIAVDVSLPDLTRLRAAALLLRVTANLGDQPSAHATWRAVRDINPIDVTSSELKLQAGMIYHLSFGSIPEGREAAEQLATRIAGSGGSFRNVALLIGLANAAQIYGDDAIAAEHASRAYGVSVSLSLSYYAVRAALRLAGIAIEQQDDRRARNWYEAALPHADNCLDAETAYELADTSAQILLLEGKPNEAAVVALANLRACEMEGVDTPFRNRTHLTTAVECLLECDPAAIDQALMDRMLDTHARMKRCMLHDRTARVLCEALSRRGELNRSAGLLDAYLAHERRSSPRPPTALLLLQARLRGSHECRA